MGANSTSTVEARVLAAFNERYWADDAAGQRPTLSHYLALFPDHEDLIVVESIGPSTR